MKVYHGRWDDSPKEFIAECETKEELMEVINNYAPKHYYLQWTDDTIENKQVIVDYGSWSDFIFIKDINNISEK